MGVAAAIGATLLGGYLNGRAQQQAYNAQAAQAQANAQIAYDNAEKLQKQGEQQAQNNAMNEENKRRRMRQLEGQNKAAIGAAGITASGSALNAMADSAYNQEFDLAVERYNGRQKVDNYFQSSTDSLNQGNVFQNNANQYRKAGKRAMMNSMLQAGLSLAGNLYSPQSEGAQKASGGVGTGGGDGLWEGFSYNGGNSMVRRTNFSTGRSSWGKYEDPFKKASRNTFGVFKLN